MHSLTFAEQLAPNSTDCSVRASSAHWDLLFEAARARGGESRGQRNRIPGCARPQRAATLISTGFLRDASALALA
jgi:hypothetical protein